MKNKLAYLSIISLLFISCIKNTDIPEISITSISTKNEVTTIKFNISDVNEIDYTGICFDTISNPDLLTNQVLKDGKVNEISIEGLKADTKIFFKAFVSGTFNYTVSKVYEYTIPYNEAPEIPCSLDSNTVVRNDISYSVTSLHSSINYKDQYELRVNISDYSVFILTFKEKPINGIYYTVDNLDKYNDNKRVNFRVQHNDYVTLSNPINVDENSLVYVENNNTGYLNISFCNITYTYTSEYTHETTNYIMKGNF